MDLEFLRTIFVVTVIAVTMPGRLFADEPRTWTSANGKYRVEAQLVEIGGKEIQLRTPDGRDISVPLAQMSRRDRDHVAKIARQRASEAKQFVPPEHIQILPVFIVPRGEPLPTRNQAALLMRHLKWSQQWFHTNLSQRDTFTLAKEVPDVVAMKQPIGFYKELEKGMPASHWVSELLDHYGLNRFDCPYMFCMVVMNTDASWPTGGGRSINGGFNRGGALLHIPSRALDLIPDVQTLLRHEIAHACGLPHVDAYGYDMTSNRSVMSYNPSHKTKGFQESPHPARLIPEDIRGLSLNARVFPKLKFDAAKDIPADYQLYRRVMWIPPMELPGHPAFDPIMTTPSGEDSGSKVAHLNRDILPSIGPGVNFRGGVMWESQKQPDGKAVLQLTFPGQVPLTAITIHSQHSGQYNRAESIIIEANTGEGFQRIAEQTLEQVDQRVTFPRTAAQDWRLTFTAGPSQKVCLRGLQYYSDETQLFPPWVPPDWHEKLAIDLPAFADQQ